MHLFDYQKSGFLLKNPSMDNQLDRFNFVTWSPVGFRSSSYFNHAKPFLQEPSLQASWRFKTSITFQVTLEVYNKPSLQATQASWGFSTSWRFKTSITKQVGSLRQVGDLQQVGSLRQVEYPNILLPYMRSLCFVHGGLLRD